MSTINPLKRISLIQRLFIRHATVKIPEHRLWLAVLCNAVGELVCGQKAEYHCDISTNCARKQARYYFKNRLHVFACDHLSLDPDWVIEVLRDHAGLDI